MSNIFLCLCLFQFNGSYSTDMIITIHFLVLMYVLYFSMIVLFSSTDYIQLIWLLLFNAYYNMRWIQNVVSFIIQISYDILYILIWVTNFVSLIYHWFFLLFIYISIVSVYFSEFNPDICQKYWNGFFLYDIYNT